jgi:hypothetical protein
MWEPLSQMGMRLSCVNHQNETATNASTASHNQSASAPIRSLVRSNPILGWNTGRISLAMGSGTCTPGDHSHAVWGDGSVGSERELGEVCSRRRELSSSYERDRLPPAVGG